MVEEVDAEIGRVLNALEKAGESGNTVVLFNSDHGEGAAHHQTVLKDFPYDEACRVPFIISFPQELQHGIIDEEHLVSGLDVVPTICDFAGANPPENARGMSIRTIAAGKKDTWRNFVVTEMNRDNGRMIRTRDYKLVAFRNNPDILFFDMRNDPGETRNLAREKDYRDLVDKHIKQLEKWENKLNYAPNTTGVFTVERDEKNTPNTGSLDPGYSLY
jgi:choline-sulfatase